MGQSKTHLLSFSLQCYGAQCHVIRMYRCYQVTPKACLKILVFLLLQLLFLLAVQEVSQQLVFQKSDPHCGKTSLEDQNGEFVPRNLATPDVGTGPLRFVRENGVVADLSSRQVNKMTTAQLLMTMHSYLDNVDVVCQRKVRMGRIDEGGWEVCDDPDVRPREPCIIYSFGINNDFSFDDDAAKMYGCHVYSFDPSMTESDQHYNSFPSL
ncbi:hypothetical protein Btru_039230 [Bulinus truncatus]|nr:hypothetical protein Btru_039230 [Bulinus truncatus]